MHTVIHNIVALTPFLFLLIGGVIVTIKTRAIQISAIPSMVALLFSRANATLSDEHTIPPHRALFTAMSTTIGIGNIVGPLVAIGIAGPGAMIGYMLATLFGCATTFVEVVFAVHFKDPSPEKRIGGPMYYLNDVFPLSVSYIYAFSTFLLVTVWTGMQSNALATIIAPYHISPLYTGFLLAIGTIIIVGGGITRVATVAEKLVPFMFLLYTSALSWIIFQNSHHVGVVWEHITSSFTLHSGAVGGSIAGIIQALRWGLSSGFQSNESGIGTATVPHSLADTNNAFNQGVLAIISVISNGILCILSGFAILLTNTHSMYGTDSIRTLTYMFQTYFPTVGPFILLVSTVLFVITTIIGNSYNGSQFFAYVFGQRALALYYALTALSIFVNAQVSLDALWAIKDFFVLPVVVPHIIGIIMLSFKYPHLIIKKIR